MKVAERTLEVTSTLQGEKVAMSIDQSALAHIMSVLTDLYSDPEMAVIREYSTNAFDAHVDAGVERPIEVWLPTPLSPFFKVRDYGFGLNAEDIREIYSRYGTSTKRDSNDVVGMLGLGCKSALTYTDQFTLSGTKDGVCTQVSISRDAAGTGEMTIVAQYETDEPSGVEIIVPVKARNYFPEKASEFYRFWKPGSVLVDGEQPKPVDGLWLADDLLVSRGDVQQNTIVMGNVPYPMPDTGESFALVAFVPIGAVQFTPSREALQMTNQTKEAIEEIKARVKKLKLSVVRDTIARATSRPEALTAALKMHGLLRVPAGELLYKGKAIPMEFKYRIKSEYLLLSGEKVKRTILQPMLVLDFEKKFRQRDGYTQTVLSTGSARESIIITGYDANLKWSATKRKKLNQWFASLGVERPQNFILLNILPYATWFDRSRVYRWADIEAQQLPRVKRPTNNNGRPAGSYEATVAGFTRATKAEDIDTSKPIFYHTKYTNHWATQVLMLEFPDATLVLLGENRIAKFSRDFPTAKDVGEALKERAESWAKSLSENSLIRLKLGAEDHFRRTLISLDPAEIDDPMLAKTIRVIKKTDAPLANRAQRLRGWATIPEPNHGWVHPSVKYPLLSHVPSPRGELVDHLHTYVNAAFAAGKGQ